MAKKEANATRKPLTSEWAKHLKPFGKKAASKRRRQAAKEIINEK